VQQNVLFIHVFFFQAEDGIRDRNVTGVQTCALPISSATTSADSSLLRTSNACAASSLCSQVEEIPNPEFAENVWAPSDPTGRDRSEERRVGKECRCRWGL